MKRLLLSITLLSFFITYGSAQTIQVLTKSYYTDRVKGDVWAMTGTDSLHLHVRNNVPITSRILFNPNSSVRFRDEVNKNYKEWSNNTAIDTVIYAFALNTSYAKPVSYDGLYDAAVSVRSQSANDNTNNLDVVFFDIADLKENIDVSVSIAKLAKDKESSFTNYSRSRVKSFKKKNYISLCISNDSSLPLYIDAIIAQEGSSSPVSILTCLNKSHAYGNLIIPPFEHIVVLTDIVVWSKVSVSIISSTEAFVLTPESESFRCTTINGTKWSVYKNSYAF